MKFRLIVTVAGALAVMPAQAQDRTDGLRELLAHVPAGVMETGEWADISYSDVQAARVGVSRDAGTMMEAMLGGSEFTSHYIRVLGLPADMVASFPFGLSGDWADVVGFQPHDISRSLTYADYPDQFAILRLAETADVPGIATTLQSNGYTQEQHGDWDVFWSVEDDHQTNLRDRDPRNPFGGNLGRSSRVALLEPFLVYSPAWPRIEEVTAGIERSALGLPAVQALLSVIDDPRHGAARLVNVIFLTEQMPAELPDGRPIPGVGIPPWELGLFADLSTGAVDRGVAAFVYGDAETADDAAAAIRTVWNDPTLYGFDPGLGDLGPPVIHVAGDGAEPAVVVVTIERAMLGEPDVVYNLPFHRFYQGMFRGDLPVFGHP